MGKGIKRSKMKSRIVEGLALPKDLMLGASSLHVVGNSDVYVENYLGIIEYGPCHVRLRLREGSLLVEGSNLCICYYSREEMKISGLLQSISFCP